MRWDERICAAASFLPSLLPLMSGRDVAGWRLAILSPLHIRLGRVTVKISDARSVCIALHSASKLTLSGRACRLGPRTACPGAHGDCLR